MFINCKHTFKYTKFKHVLMASTDFQNLKLLLKQSNLRLILALSEGPKRWSELEKIMNKRLVSESLKELIGLNVVGTEEHQKGLQKVNIYYLTDYGRLVLKKLEELEAILESAKAREGWVKVGEVEID